jgi:CRP-like cAMP-binding protein
MGLNDDIAAMGRVPTLAFLEPDALRLLAFAAETRILRAGDVLFRRGEEADAGFIVVSGAIALDARDDGSPASYIAGPGTLVGELALLVPVVRPATAIARESSSVLRLSRTLVHRVLAEFPRSALALRQALSERLTAFSRELAALGEIIEPPKRRA